MIAENDVLFDYGLQIEVGEMEPDTIYLDGVVRGPVVDNERRSYSFDHHGDCLRMATLATCQQVRLALELGLDPEGMSVVVNDLDADASLGLWLLRNPERADDERVRQMVGDVGFVDAHGPVRQATKLHRVLTHGHDANLDRQMLWDDQALIDDWYRDGDAALPTPDRLEAAPAFGVTRGGEFCEFDAVDSFAELYERGVVAGVIIPEAPGDTRGYTVAKRSEFVDFDVQAFLHRIEEYEAGWGGASTIGGAPRRSGGERSTLPVDTVRQLFRNVAGNSE